MHAPGSGRSNIKCFFLTCVSGHILGQPTLHYKHNETFRVHTAMGQQHPEVGYGYIRCPVSSWGSPLSQWYKQWPPTSSELSSFSCVVVKYRGMTITLLKLHEVHFSYMYLYMCMYVPITCTCMKTPCYNMSRFDSLSHTHANIQ